MPIEYEGANTFLLKNHSGEALAAGLVKLQELVGGVNDQFYEKALQCQQIIESNPQARRVSALIKSVEFEGGHYLLDAVIFPHQRGVYINCHSGGVPGLEPIRLTAELWETLTIVRENGISA